MGSEKKVTKSKIKKEDEDLEDESTIEEPEDVELEDEEPEDVKNKSKIKKPTKEITFSDLDKKFDKLISLLTPQQISENKKPIEIAVPKKPVLNKGTEEKIESEEKEEKATSWLENLSKKIFR